MPYTKHESNWQSGAGGGTPITEAALDHIEQGIADAHALEVDGSTEVASTVLTGSLADIATVSLSIPAGWSGYKIVADASYVVVGDDIDGGSDRTFAVLVTIGGTAQQQQDFTIPPTDSTTPHPVVGSIGGRRTGMSAGGSVDVKLRASGADSMTDVFLYARAFRTA